jgi:nucleoside permease NupC
MSLQKLILVLLPLLSLVGAFGTWILGGANGTFPTLTALIAQGDTFLFGSNIPPLKTYTGIGFIDHQLLVLVTFFAPIFSSETPLALFCIVGFGQFGAAWTLMVMESMRFGNKGKAVS